MSGDSVFWKALGLSSAVANAASNKKTLNKVQKFNSANRGVTIYQPCPAQALFPSSEPVGCSMLSGGDPLWRTHAIAAACEWGADQGYIPVVLHTSPRLGTFLSQYFGSGSIVSLDAGSKRYDPFIGLNNDEIDRIIIRACPKSVEIKPAGRYYLDGISDYIRACGRRPAAYMFIGCPHQDLIDQINNAAAKGAVPAATAQKILSMLLQGEAERGSIETFFSQLSLHGGGMLANKQTIASAQSLRSIVSSGRFCVANASSGANACLLNVMLAEAQELLSVGARLLLVLDGIRSPGNEFLKDMLRNAGGPLAIILSDDDVYAAMGASDADFFSFAGKSSKLIVSRHASAASAQKWSDVIGSYDKLDVSTTMAANVNHIGHFSYGHTSTNAIAQKRENIVKPEELQRLDGLSAFMTSSGFSEVARVSITI